MKDFTLTNKKPNQKKFITLLQPHPHGNLQNLKPQTKLTLSLNKPEW